MNTTLHMKETRKDVGDIGVIIDSISSQMQCKGPLSQAAPDTTWCTATVGMVSIAAAVQHV